VSSEAVANRGWASAKKPDMRTPEADYRPFRTGPACFKRNGALALAQEGSEMIGKITMCDFLDRTVCFGRWAVRGRG